jgi:phosphoribosylaminoimidazolecarboxamide formyltransferase/IMP cyclohydrolase
MQPGNQTSTDRITRVRRALLSVYRKDDIVPFARTLTELGVELVSTGGTGRLLREAGLSIRRVSELTGVPEMLDGRVKTLHPMVHAGILAIRDNHGHRRDLDEYGAAPIDLVVVNLYPFEQTTRMGDIGLAEVVEMIDIGGPTMVRAAAKNFRDVGVIVDPRDYPIVLDELQSLGGLTEATRLRLALHAFRHTAAYDTAIYSFLQQIDPAGRPRAEDSLFPPTLEFELHKLQELRYGENPHQRAALYGQLQGNEPSLTRAEQIQGTELSFNNLLDLDAAMACVASFSESACAVIKHNNPSGVAIAPGPSEAFRNAKAADPVSAFGGIVAFNRPIDVACAEELTGMFLEAVIAPDALPDAREVLAKKPKLRVLLWGDPREYRRPGLDLRRITGGFLVQEWDTDDQQLEFKLVSKREPTASEWDALRFAWQVCRHVRSNAIVLAGSDHTVGIGAGQMSRVDAVMLAAHKAGPRAAGSVMASDAFFPFRDGIDQAAQHGITAVVQPGGSVRDREVIDAADDHGMAMVLTGRRHFRH